MGERAPVVVSWEQLGTCAVLRASRASTAAEKKPHARRTEVQEACRQAMEAAARGLEKIAHGLLTREGVSIDGFRIGAKS